MSANHPLPHRVGTVARIDDGRIIAHCACGGFQIVSPDRFAEPDIDKRKDFAFEELSKHILAQPEIRKMLGLEHS